MVKIPGGAGGGNALVNLERSVSIHVTGYPGWVQSIHSAGSSTGVLQISSLYLLVYLLSQCLCAYGRLWLGFISTEAFRDQEPIQCCVSSPAHPHWPLCATSIASGYKS